MRRFDIAETIKPIKRLMLLTGTWPERSPALTYRFIGFLTISMCSALSVTALVKVFTDFEDIKSVSLGTCCSMAALHTVVKHCILFFNKPQFYKIMDSLKEPIFAFHADCLDIFLQEKVRLIKLCRSAFFIASLGTGFTLISCPTLATQTERPLPVPFPLDMKDQHRLVYYSIYVVQSITVMLVCITLACFDGMIFTFIAIAPGQLKIVREKIHHAPNSCPPSTSLQSQQENDAKINKILKQCIEHHLAIERFIKLIEDTFTIGFLIQLLISLIVTCLIGFNILLLSVASLDFVKCLLFFVAAIIELAFFCVPANEIVLQSERIRDACYMSDWIDCGISIRKTLFIIMERSKRPLSLSAAHFVDLSLNTLFQVLKSSYTYFTVLRKLYKDSST